MSDRGILHQSTVSRWREELAQLLAGKRDAHVRQLGSAEEYVFRLLRDADDRDEANAAFKAALADEVTAWQVGLDDSFYFVRGILQLICAFTPAPGFVKAVEFLERRLREPLQGDEDELRLPRLALAALSRFYPVAPPDAVLNPAFRRYLEVLDSLTSVPAMAAMAMRHTLQLGTADLSDPELARAVIDDPNLMSVAVEFALARSRPRSPRHLQALFRACVESGLDAFRSFLDELERHDAPAMPEERHLLVAPVSGEKIPLRADDMLEAYTMIRWTWLAEPAFEKFEAMSA